MKLLLNLLKSDDSMVQFCTHELIDDTIQLLQFVPKEDPESLCEAEFFYLFYEYFKGDANYLQAFIEFTIYVLQSGYKSSYSPTILLLHKITRETDFTPLSSEELCEELINKSTVCSDILVYFFLNITKLNELIQHLPLKYFLTKLQIKSGGIHTEEKWESDIPSQVISCKEIQNSELSILTVFFSRVIDSNIIEIDQYLLDILLPYIIYIINSNAFSVKYYALQLECSIFQNIPSSFLNDIDLSIFINIFEQMFDQTTSSPSTILNIIKTILSLYEIGQKSDDSICQLINQSPLIQEILNYISDYEEYEESEEETERKMVFDKFISIFHINE